MHSVVRLHERNRTMLIAALLILPVIVIALGTWIYLDFIRCRKTRARVKQIETATTDLEILAAGSDWAISYGRPGWCHLLRRDRERTANRKYDGANYRDEQSREEDRAKNTRAKLDAETDPYKRISILLEAHGQSYLSRAGFGMTRDQITTLFQTCIESILVPVRTGDAVAMHDFAQLMGRSWLSRFCLDYNIDRPQFPENWDDLVVEHNLNPTVKDFRNTPDLSVGEVRDLAAEALKLRDTDPRRARKLAKLVLAYCLVEREVMGNYGRDNGSSRQVLYPYRIQVTGQLVSQLIVMVNAMEGRTTYSQQVNLGK